MKLSERQNFTEKFFKECSELLSKKGKDYNPDGKAFKDVYETAQEIGMSPEKVLWIHFKKHYTAIKAYIKKGKTESEPIDERLKDLANYCNLMYVLRRTRPGDYVDSFNKK